MDFYAALAFFWQNKQRGVLRSALNLKTAKQARFSGCLYFSLTI
jgi:hypothetical protein